MEREFISILKYDKLIELILAAQKFLIFSAVNLHDEVAIYISEAKKRGVKVNVVIDLDEENIRNGYGEIKSIDILSKVGIEVNQIDGNLISFIIVDDVGYFLFQQSRVHLEDAKGPNAVLMDDIIRRKLIAYYFPFDENEEYFDELYIEDDEIMMKIKSDLDEIIDVPGSEKQLKIKPLNNVKVERIRKNLKINPPLQPDLKRRINTYTTKVQFVELKFIGANFSSKKIPLPKDALPFRDAELKNAIESKLNLFDNLGENEDFKKFKQIKNMEEAIREKYLIPITCRNKSLIKVLKKEEFLEDLKLIQEKINKYKNAGLQELEKAMLNRKKAIKKELTEFMKENPPKDYSHYDQNFLFDKIEDDIQTVVSRLKFPTAQSLITGLEIKYNFYDLTFEDFRDDELIQEFKDKYILKSEELEDIVSIKNAFEATIDEKEQAGRIDKIKE